MKYQVRITKRAEYGKSTLTLDPFIIEAENDDKAKGVALAEAEKLKSKLNGSVIAKVEIEIKGTWQEVKE